MRIIASIVFSLVVAIFAVKANMTRHQDESDQIAIDEAKESGKRSADEFIAETHIVRLQRQIPMMEESVRSASNPSDLALAIEDLRESRAELRRYQSQLSR